MMIKGERYIVFLVKQSRGEAEISDNCQEGFTRARKLTMKGLLHKKTLRERRKINSRLIRKYGTTEDLLCSSKNKVTVEEEMSQFNDLLKMLIDVHQDYNQLLEHNEREKDEYREAVRVFQIREVGTPDYQRVHIDQGHQRTQNHQGKRI